jgi:3-methyladenine DNA glycosylase AlkD
MKHPKVFKELLKIRNLDKAENLSRFFKCGQDEYGAGDKFLGIVVPEQRKIVQKYYQIVEIGELEKLLKSEFHEARLTALLMLVEKFVKGDEKIKKQIYKVYLKNTRYINNWDLVDLSAPRIVGGYLLNKDRKILYRLAKSKNLWEKRIAVLATFTFIRIGQFTDVFKISEVLLNDPHDLIHKAVGWMLREVGKRNIKEEERFLKKYYKTMPRTMLRYAIEKFPEGKRKKYLKK